MTTEYSEGFLAFWQAYPRKQAKPKAWESWQKQKCEECWRGIVSHVDKRAKVDRQWKDGFIPMPTTFLNQNRWLDEGWEPKHREPSELKKPDEILSPPPQPDGWKANLNRVLFSLVNEYHGVPDDALPRLIKGRDYYANQFREMWGEEAPKEEFDPVLDGVRKQFRRVIEGKA